MDVVGVGSDKQMVDADATPIVAGVAQHHADGDIASPIEPVETVRLILLLLVLDHTVAVVTYGSRPLKAPSSFV